MKIERTTNAKGEAVFTATVPIPDGVDPDWFAEFFERALSTEIAALQSHVEASLDDAADDWLPEDEHHWLDDVIT